MLITVTLPGTMPIYLIEATASDITSEKGLYLVYILIN